MSLNWESKCPNQSNQPTYWQIIGLRILSKSYKRADWAVLQKYVIFESGEMFSNTVKLTQLGNLPDDYAYFPAFMLVYEMTFHLFISIKLCGLILIFISPPYCLPLKYLITKKLMNLDCRVNVSAFAYICVPSGNDSADEYFPSYFINQNCNFISKFTRGVNLLVFMRFMDFSLRYCICVIIDVNLSYDPPSEWIFPLQCNWTEVLAMSWSLE